MTVELHSRRLWPAVVVLATALAACGGPEAPPQARPLTERIKSQFPDLPNHLPPLSDPEVVTAEAAHHMRDDDVVLGVLTGGTARAYPWWIAKNYHAINDRIGDLPVLVTLCEQCSAATAYRRRLDDRILSMIVLGVHKGTIILSDVETGSLWSPFEGLALEGPLAGRELERLPGFLLRWREWVERHPATDVIYDEEWRRQGHGSSYSPGSWGIAEEMGRTIDRWDTRLPEHTMVLGIEVDGRSKAYDFDSVKAAGGVVNDRVGELPVVVVAAGEFETIGYARTLDGRALSFEPAAEPGAFMADLETRSLWTIEGRAILGELAGQRLEQANGFAGEWHVWSGYNPGTELFVRSASGAAIDTLRLPALDLERLDPGRPVELNRAVNVVALWASWCPPCKVELPRLQKLADAWSERDVAVTTVAVHLTYERRIHDFLRASKIRLPVLLVDDPHYQILDRLSKTATGKGVILPMVFVTDSQRRIRAVLQGEEVESLERVVDELLAGHAAAPPVS